jgi:threonyl-tRNA synthetase
MLHAACFGSLDRFLGMYIETIEGKFPLWFNPVHACIINVNSESSPFCEKVYQKLKEAGLRVKIDLENKTVQQKVAIYSQARIPYLLTIGKNEEKTNSVSIKIFGSSSSSPIVMKIDEFIKKVQAKIDKKDIDFNL